MKIKNFPKSSNLINFRIFLIDKYFQIKNRLFFKLYYKKKIILRNSYKSDSFFFDLFKDKINFKKLREILFDRNLFAYSNPSEKDDIIKYLNENCSSTIKKYIKYANKIVNKEFSIFEKKHKFENEINWSYGFFNNFYWNLEQSEKINIRPQKNVDVKYVWKLNRHQYLTYLGFAYYITKDKKYAIEFKNQILHWIKKNPPLYGINWYSGLEISIRLISWIFSLYFFIDSREINNDVFFKKIFNSMLQHTYYLKYFYTKRSFNHTIGELFGLYLFCKIFNTLKPIRKWESTVFSKFKSQIFLQTRPDGTNIEQSVNYHRFVLEYFSLFLILNPIELSKKGGIIIEKMYEYLTYIIKPDGSAPLVGDSDDGKVLLLTFFKKNPYKEVISLGSIIFQRGDFKYISKKIYPSSILLLGTKGYEIYNKLSSEPPKNKIKYFENAGYISIRNNWTETANYLFVDFGRFGAKNAPHTHSSITNFIFSHRGKNIINDSGTYTYNKSWKDRNLFRSSKAHNILTIMQKNQAKITSWFSWENKPKIKRIIEIKNNLIKLICFHNGYRGFKVKREILTKKDLNKITVKDLIIQSEKLLNQNKYEIDIFFHFNKDTDIKINNSKIIINNNLVFNVSSKESFYIYLKKFLYSPQYGIKFENNVLNIHLEHKFKKKKVIEVITEIKALK